jgi:hypothetical protein
MWEFSLFHWAVVLAIVVLLFLSAKTPRGRHGRPSTHPIPVNSSVETSKASQTPKEKPWEALLGFLRRQHSR